MPRDKQSFHHLRVLCDMYARARACVLRRVYVYIMTCGPSWRAWLRLPPSVTNTMPRGSLPLSDVACAGPLVRGWRVQRTPYTPAFRLPYRVDLSHIVALDRAKRHRHHG